MKTSNKHPQVAVDNVVLTCEPDTSQTVTSYEWYKDGVKITKDAATATYSVPGNAKTNSGNFECKVMAEQVTPSPFSDDFAVTFLCKLLSISSPSKKISENRTFLFLMDGIILVSFCGIHL